MKLFSRLGFGLEDFARCSLAIQSSFLTEYSKKKTGLKGGLAGYYAVKVTGNYRIIFRFADGDAFDIDYIDYH